MDAVKRKYKGGALKNREKHQKILNTEAQKCHKITDMFKVPTLSKVGTYYNFPLHQ